MYFWIIISVSAKCNAGHNLGAIVDADFTFQSHISGIIKSWFDH